MPLKVVRELKLFDEENSEVAKESDLVQLTIGDEFFEVWLTEIDESGIIEFEFSNGASIELFADDIDSLIVIEEGEG